MQPQINAIKQLLETNNAITSRIEEILVQSLGDRASWENASGFKELSDFDDYLSSVGDDTIQLNESVKWDFGILWRSRIDLNDARINAEEVALDGFLTILKGSITEYRIKDDLDVKKHLKERDHEISLLKTQIKELKIDLKLVNSKAKELICDESRGHLNLLEKLAERDHEIADLNLALEGIKKEYLTRKSQLEERDRQIQELQTSLRNHHEQFDALKSRTEVTLKAIAMMLESLKGDRKPDEVKEVDGVMVRFRDYDDNLTHHHKTIIIGNIQRVIANEARNLETRTLQDFSYDDQPF